MSDLAEYQSWLESGFAWLADNWTEGDWADVRAGFVTALGLATAEDDLVVHALVAEIDQLAPELQRETVLGHPAQGELVQRALAAAGGTAEAGPADAADTPAPAAAPGTDPTAAAAAVEPVYVEGTGWMRWDADTGAWVATESETPAAASSAAAAAPAAAPAAEPAPEPAPDAAAPSAAEPAQEPAQVAAQVAEQIVLPALTEALAAAPQLAELSAEELNRLMSEVLAERLAAAG